MKLHLISLFVVLLATPFVSSAWGSYQILTVSGQAGLAGGTDPLQLSGAILTVEFVFDSIAPPTATNFSSFADFTPVSSRSIWSGSSLSTSNGVFGGSSIMSERATTLALGFMFPDGTPDYFTPQATFATPVSSLNNVFDPTSIQTTFFISGGLHHYSPTAGDTFYDFLPQKWSIAAVPEPSGIVVWTGIGVTGVLFARFRKKMATGSDE